MTKSDYSGSKCDGYSNTIMHSKTDGLASNLGLGSVAVAFYRTCSGYIKIVNQNDESQVYSKLALFDRGEIVSGSDNLNTTWVYDWFANGNYIGGYDYWTRSNCAQQAVNQDDFYCVKGSQNSKTLDVADANLVLGVAFTFRIGA